MPDKRPVPSQLKDLLVRREQTEAVQASYHNPFLETHLLDGRRKTGKIQLRNYITVNLYSGHRAVHQWAHMNANSLPLQ